MSVAVTLLELIKGTDLDGRVRRFSVRIFGREVARYTARTAPDVAARAFDREAARLMFLVIAGDIARLLRLHERLLIRFPGILSKVEKEAFTEMVAVALKRGDSTFESLRGLLVEHLARVVPEFASLETALNRVRLAANRRAPGWGVPRLVTGVTDGAGKQLGDLLFICEHADGRMWVMAVIESKSISNTADLVAHGERPVGQHLWDYVRARTAGLVVDGRLVRGSRLVMQPMPVAAWGGAAVVGPKTLAARLAEFDGQTFTAFIGFAPRELTLNEALRTARQGIQLELWRWPFNLDEYDRFQKLLVETLARAGY